MVWDKKHSARINENYVKVSSNSVNWSQTMATGPVEYFQNESI